MTSSLALQLAVGVEVSRSPAAAAAAASLSPVAEVEVPGWWDSRCGDASSTTPSCPSPTMTVHRRHSWDPLEARVGVGVAVLGELAPGVGATAAEKAWGVEE